MSAFSEFSFTCHFLSLSFFFFSNFVFFPKFSCLFPCVLAISVAVFSVYYYYYYYYSDAISKRDKKKKKKKKKKEHLGVVRIVIVLFITIESKWLV